MYFLAQNQRGPAGQLPRCGNGQIHTRRFGAKRTFYGDWNDLRGCTSKASNALNAVSGVDHVEVSLEGGDATVRFNEQATSVEQLKSAVKKAGYGVDGTMQSKGGCCG